MAIPLVRTTGENIAGPTILKVDDTGTVTYLGTAKPGTATSAASWRVKKVTNASGDIVWADGDDSYDNVWDDRASLSYS